MHSIKEFFNNINDLFHFPKNNGTMLRSGWTKIRAYENVHPNLIVVLLSVHTEVECKKGPLGMLKNITNTKSKEPKNWPLNRVLLCFLFKNIFKY